MLRTRRVPFSVILPCLVLSACGSAENHARIPTPTPTTTATATLADSPTPTPTATPDQRALTCRDSGGVAATALCCASVGEFPSTCGLGACGCAPSASHPVRVCQCGAGRCFDGTSCIARETPTPTHTLDPLTPTRTPTADDSALPCLQTGGAESPRLCCLAADNFPDTCNLATCACPPDVSHTVRVCECGLGRCYDPQGAGCVEGDPL